MCLKSLDPKTTETSAYEEQIELILDLTRRLHLLEQLMTAARFKRLVAAETTDSSAESFA